MALLQIVLFLLLCAVALGVRDAIGGRTQAAAIHVLSAAGAVIAVAGAGVT